MAEVLAVAVAMVAVAAVAGALTVAVVYRWQRERDIAQKVA